MTQQSNPFADLERLMQQFKVPGVDVAGIVESGRKDLEALVEANKSAYEGLQALAHKQREMWTHALEQVQQAAHHSGGAAPAERQLESARDAYRKVLIDMKELADIVRRSQAEAMSRMTDRAIDHLKEFKKLVHPK